MYGHLIIKFFPGPDWRWEFPCEPGALEDEQAFFELFFRGGAETVRWARDGFEIGEADRILTENFIEGSGIRWMVTQYGIRDDVGWA